ncbi:MAG: hypothetical protein PCFJNLEI_00849 [Verrucomicrobiae bacterium]|nr:hypothetical protein [Verrucomicrobiae bacterium]
MRRIKPGVGKVCGGCMVIMLLAGVVFPPARAANFSWNSGTATGGSGLWTNSALWNPGGGPPTSPADTAFITNFVTANRTITVDNPFTIAELTAASAATGTSQRILTLNNGLTLQITTATTLGSNTLFNVGNNTTGGSTLSNNHLTLQDNGTLTLNGNTIANISTLIVAGTFSNSTTSTIVGASGLGRLRFTASGITTNRGTLNFVTASAASGQSNLVLQAATFFNSGTINLGITGNTTARQSVFSNQFINAGLLVLTNNSSNAGGTYSFTVTSGTVTNTASGTLRFITDGTGSGVRNVATFTSGGLVNLGTLSFLQTGGTAGNNNDLVIADGSTFSNAPGGQLIVAAGNIGNIRVLANRSLNLGTNLVQAGTLTYLTATAGNGFLDNAGVIQLDNANLGAAANLTNLAAGLIRVGPGNTGTLVNRVINNTSATLAANGGTLALLATPDQRGNILVTNTGTLQLGTTGTLAWTNTGTLSLQNGTVLSGNLTNTAGGVIQGSGFGTFTGNMINRVGGVVTAKQARLTFHGVVTNAGSVKMLNSIGTFNAAVVNSGAWITDPTTNIFHNTFTVTSSGSVNADVGDVYEFRENFVNQSGQTQTWNMLNAPLNTSSTGAANLGTKFLFSGDSVTTQEFFHAGLTLTGGFLGLASTATETQAVVNFSAVAGFQNNFALGTLELTNTILKLSDTFGTVSADDGLTGGLFVKNLFLYGGTELIISNNMRLYFINSNNWVAAGSTVTLLGNAEIHQLTGPLAIVPEPSVLLFLLTGGAVMIARRRRQRRAA